MIGSYAIADVPIAGFRINAEFYLGSQTLTATLNHVQNGPITALVTGQTLSSTLNSVSLSYDYVVSVTGQGCYSYVSPVTIAHDFTVPVTGQRLRPTINNALIWDNIRPGQNSVWADIAFGELFYGDNFAVAATPIGDIVQCRPLRRNPPQNWNSINATTPTSWSPIVV